MSEATKKIRNGIKEAADSLDSVQPTLGSPPAFTYVPLTHARALDPEATLVEGIRGSGKSFWWSLLVSEKHRKFVKENFPETRLPANLQIAQGFGNGLSISQAPDLETLVHLVQHYKPRSIWRAVVAQHAVFDGEFIACNSWSERVAWVQKNPETFAKYLEAADKRLAESSKMLLVLFDALDRLADNWDDTRQLAKGLLQVALEMRSTRHIRCKVYIRPDILQDENITSFPDYSKLLAGKASLEWRRADLYALLYQCLGNSSGQDEFRKLLRKNKNGTAKSIGTWRIPDELRVDEDYQEEVFEQLAGKAMGNSTKRGKPYTWLVNHLQDGFNQVSPRSFLAALKAASSDAVHLNEDLPIDYRGIQLGVQKASQIRVQEISEDYAWVRFVMEPLISKLTVPCTVKDIDAIWKNEKTLQGLEKKIKKSESTVAKLPPQHLANGTAGVMTDLEDLGMIQQLDGKRVQMPDVYRVAFGLGRRGGVKPLR
jgi:hypothetical protein